MRRKKTKKLKPAPAWAITCIKRYDRGILEYVCIHGVGHPVPESITREVDGVHGCDGCCRKASH